MEGRVERNERYGGREEKEVEGEKRMRGGRSRREHSKPAVNRGR